MVLECTSKKGGELLYEEREEDDPGGWLEYGQNSDKFSLYETEQKQESVNNDE